MSEPESAVAEPEETELEKEKKMLAKREMIIQEILQTERTYCSQLNQIVSDYLVPFRTEGDKLSRKNIDLMFSNIEEINNLNQRILNDMEAAIQSGKSTFGDVFMKLVPFLTLYKQYCANHNQASMLYNTKMETSAKFYYFILKLKEQGAHDLPSLLITPIQRIPRYRLLFEELVKTTPTTHPDYNVCHEALLQIQGIAEYVNESIRDRENQEAIAKVQNSLIGKVPHLWMPNRKFIKEGVLVKLCRREPKRRYFFLFTDIMVYASMLDTTVSNKTQYKYHRLIPLSKCMVKEIDDNEVMQNAFQILSEKKSFMVFAESARDKDDWIEKINESIKQAAKIQFQKQQSKAAVPKPSSSSSSVVSEEKKDVEAPEGEKKEEEKADDIAPVWVPDKLLKNCMLCSVKFTTINRRHHCRRCGKLVCNACSSQKYKLPNIGKMCRVCTDCYSSLTGTPAAPRVQRAVVDTKPQDNAKISFLAQRATKKFVRRENAAKVPLPATKARAPSILLRAGVYKGDSPSPSDGADGADASESNEPSDLSSSNNDSESTDLTSSGTDLSLSLPSDSDGLSSSSSSDKPLKSSRSKRKTGRTLEKGTTKKRKKSIQESQDGTEATGEEKKKKRRKKSVVSESYESADEASSSSSATKERSTHKKKKLASTMSMADMESFRAASNRHKSSKSKRSKRTESGTLDPEMKSPKSHSPLLSFVSTPNLNASLPLVVSPKGPGSPKSPTTSSVKVTRSATTDSDDSSEDEEFVTVEEASFLYETDGFETDDLPPPPPPPIGEDGFFIFDSSDSEQDLDDQDDDDDDHDHNHNGVQSTPRDNDEPLESSLPLDTTDDKSDIDQQKETSSSSETKKETHHKDEKEKEKDAPLVVAKELLDPVASPIRSSGVKSDNDPGSDSDLDAMVDDLISMQFDDTDVPLREPPPPPPPPPPAED